MDVPVVVTIVNLQLSTIVGTDRHDDRLDVAEGDVSGIPRGVHQARERDGRQVAVAKIHGVVEAYGLRLQRISTVTSAHDVPLHASRAADHSIGVGHLVTFHGHRPADPDAFLRILQLHGQHVVAKGPAKPEGPLQAEIPAEGVPIAERTERRRRRGFPWACGDGSRRRGGRPRATRDDLNRNRVAHTHGTLGLRVSDGDLDFRWRAHRISTQLECDTVHRAGIQASFAGIGEDSPARSAQLHVCPSGGSEQLHEDLLAHSHGAPFLEHVAAFSGQFHGATAWDRSPVHDVWTSRLQCAAAEHQVRPALSHQRSRQQEGGKPAKASCKPPRHHWLQRRNARSGRGTSGLGPSPSGAC
eukprot:scaffold8264_cov372-Pinguiococcus_pyrenoidosus.AAC.2